jgi:CTD small phosphatase-like protein 2
MTPKKAYPQKPVVMPPRDKSDALSGMVTRIRPTQSVNRQQEHLLATFQAVKVAKNLREPTLEEIANKQVKLPRKKGYEKKKTVIFDLDETLVHCVGATENGHVELEIEFPTSAVTKVSINIRPYVRELLSAISKDFEVVLFTASHKCYADKVIDYLDPDRQLIHHRLYRNNCIQIDGIFIKDLRIFVDRNLKDLVIVDNATYSFAFQLTNGIPIISWYNDMADRELFKLIEYLRMLARVDDLRIVNQLTFHLDTFYEDYLRDFIAKAEKENFN